nr:ribosome-binding protein 1-like [Coffea arabica]
MHSQVDNDPTPSSQNRRDNDSSKNRRNRDRRKSRTSEAVCGATKRVRKGGVANEGVSNNGAATEGASNGGAAGQGASNGGAVGEGATNEGAATEPVTETGAATEAEACENREGAATEAETEAGPETEAEHNPLLDDIVEGELNSDPDSEDEDVPVRYTSFNASRDGTDPHFHVGQKFGTKK